MASGYDQGWSIGAQCFYNDEARGWIVGKVEKVVGVGRAATLTVRAVDGGAPVQKEASEIEAASQRAMSGVDDMVQLDELTEATVLSTLRVRYGRKDIYTNVGGILIAVNPYESLEEHIYGPDQMRAYAAADAAFAGMTPHPYLLAEAALRALDRDRSSQSFVISGESGSGKTETCKYVLRYLSYRSKRRADPTMTKPGGRALEEAVLLSNPILESFGNAKTLRNDNSSRWGKYTQVYVQPSSGAIKRVGITAYLLEKVRIVERAAGERNFHVLYQLVAGRKANGADAGLSLAKTLGDAAVQHAVLRDKGYDRRDASAPSVAGIGVDDGDQFKATRKAFAELGIDEVGVFGALAAVCHLSDVCFDEVAQAGSDPHAEVSKQDLRQRGGLLSKVAGRHALDFSAEALGVDRKELEEALVARRLGTTRVPRRAAEAEHAKAAFAKALYARVFDWVLARVNEALKAMTGTTISAREALTGKKSAKEDLLTIGLLDIFGFECFAHNSLEQLLINYANERLLREFNVQVFEAATREYAAEGVPVGDLTFQDNAPLLQTLENPRDGVFAMLNSECVRRDGGDPNLLKSLVKRHARAPGAKVAPGPKSGVYVPKVTRASSAAEREAAGACFGVSHFAADVVYQISGFVEKNRDRLPAEICGLAATSDAVFVAGLFADVDEDGGAGGGSFADRGGRAAGGGGNAKRSQRYVAGAFAESLGKLTGLLDATAQSFVRCVKPNTDAAAENFNNVMVLDQLRCMGMLELVAARARGYAYRADHATFASRYGILLEDCKGVGNLARFENPTRKGLDEFCGLLSAKAGVAEASKATGGVAIGKTKVFLKRGAHNALETAREKRLCADVLLALGEATASRDADALELTLRIADELRLAESAEAKAARATLTDERFYRDLVEAVAAGDAALVAATLSDRGVPEAGPAVGSAWSKYVGEGVDVARVSLRGLRMGEALKAPKPSELVRLGAEGAAARDALAAAAAAKRPARPADVESPPLPVEALRAQAAALGELVKAAEAAALQVKALEALRAATEKRDKKMLDAALAAYDKPPNAPAVQAEVDKAREVQGGLAKQAAVQATTKAAWTLARERVKDADAAAYLERSAQPLAALEEACARAREHDWLAADAAAGDKGVAALRKARTTVDERVKELALAKLAADDRAAALAAQKKEADAKAAAQQKADDERAAAAAAAKQKRTDAEASSRAAAEEANRPPPPPGPALESLSEDELARVRERELNKSRAKQMEGLVQQETQAINAEGAKLKQLGTTLFVDMPWAARVEALRAGSRMLKLSSTSTMQGAEWKHVKLVSPADEAGVSLLAKDQGMNPQAKAGSYLTWTTTTLMRKGSRKLPLGSITSVHIGTNAKQWCTMVPTEWHYMTLMTRERSYDFGFEEASELLLWVNTLQRVTFPAWTQQCNAGEMAELFKGAISDAQHRFYRSSRAGASSSDFFVPSLQELCPVLYPLAPALCGTCAELGVSFANAAPRPHKFCMWTAVAVIEAPISHEEAVISMRAVLSDLGFYANGRFACSAGFYDENGLAHTLARDAITHPSLVAGGRRDADQPEDPGMLVIRAQHAKTGKVSVLKIKKGTKMASVFEAHAKHKGLKSQSLSVMKNKPRPPPTPPQV